MTPADWYPDPYDPTALRYWDGTAWTEHRAPRYATAQPVSSYGQQWAPAHGAGALQPVRSFGFGEAISRGLHKWTDYSGRANRSEYWWFYLFFTLVILVPYVLLLVAVAVTSSQTDGYDQYGRARYTEVSPGWIAILVVAGVLLLIAVVVLFLPHLALLVRRLHDTDKSGWWVLIGFVPFASIVLLVFAVLPSMPGANRYGPPVT